MKVLVSCVKGALVGFASILPGISGSLSAVILGVYESLLDALSKMITSPIETIKAHYDLFLGILFGILVGALSMDYLYQRIPIILLFIFAGAIAGSLPKLFKKTSFHQKPQTSLSLIAVTFLLFVLFIGLSDRHISPLELGFTSAFLVALVASAAVVIPGLSAATVLIVLGAYQEVIGLGTTAIKLIAGNANMTFARFLIIITGLVLGAVIGLVIVAKGISYLLLKMPGHVMSVVFGLALASLYSLFNTAFDLYQDDLERSVLMIVLTILFFILSTILSYLFSSIPHKEMIS